MTAIIPCTAVDLVRDRVKQCKHEAVVEFYVGGTRFARCDKHLSAEARARAEAEGIRVVDLVSA